MKLVRLALSLALLSLSTAAFAQHEGHALLAPPPNAVKTEADLIMDKLRTLAGSWEGPVSNVADKEKFGDPAVEKVGGNLTVTMQNMSHGLAIMHEMSGAGGVHVNPVTMFYVSNNQAMATHYCAMGNRPRLAGKMSPDGKTIEFEFLDVDGTLEHGHMHHAIFTFVDADHHNEDWDFFIPGVEKPLRGHAELHRTK